MITPETIVAAFLAIFPYMNGNNRQCIEQQQPRIIHQLREVAQPTVPGLPAPPVELTASVAFLETHLGCDINEGGNWGAPVSATRRHTAGTHMHAVHALSVGYVRCGSWEGAVRRFRTGLCNPERQSQNSVVQRQGTLYLRTVNSIMDRLVRYNTNPFARPITRGQH
jgi:hypothetical protein